MLRWILEKIGWKRINDYLKNLITPHNKFIKHMSTERITGKFILNKFLLAFDFDTGFLLTIKELTIRPGKTIRKYIEGDRKIYDPIKFLTIVLVLVFFIAFLLDYFDTGALNYGRISDEIKITFYQGATLSIILGSIVFYFLFKKKYNFFETISLFTYIMGYILFVLVFISSLVNLLLYLITKDPFFISLTLPDTVQTSLMLSYIFWVLKSFYKSTIVKTFFLTLIFPACLYLTTIFDTHIQFLTKTDNPSRVGILFRVQKNNSNTDNKTVSYLVIDSIYTNSGAEKSGLKVGDALLKINGRRTSLSIFNSQIQNYQVGEVILIEILRTEKKMYVPVILMHKDSLSMD